MADILFRGRWVKLPSLVIDIRRKGIQYVSKLHRNLVDSVYRTQTCPSMGRQMSSSKGVRLSLNSGSSGNVDCWISVIKVFFGNFDIELGLMFQKRWRCRFQRYIAYCKSQNFTLKGKTLESTSIWHRYDTNVSYRFRIDVDPKVFAD